MEHIFCILAEGTAPQLIQYLMRGTLITICRWRVTPWRGDQKPTCSTKRPLRFLRLGATTIHLRWLWLTSRGGFCTHGSASELRASYSQIQLTRPSQSEGAQDNRIGEIFGNWSFASLVVGVYGSEGRVEVWGIKAVIGATSSLLGLLPVEVPEAGISININGIRPFGMITSSSPCLIQKSYFFWVEHFVLAWTNISNFLSIVLHCYWRIKISSNCFGKQIRFAFIAILIKSNHFCLPDWVYVLGVAFFSK